MLRLVFRKTNASRPQRPAAVQWMVTSTFAVPQRLSVEVTGAGVLSDTLLNDRFPASATTIENVEGRHRPHGRRYTTAHTAGLRVGRRLRHHGTFETSGAVHARDTDEHGGDRRGRGRGVDPPLPPAHGPHSPPGRPLGPQPGPRR